MGNTWMKLYHELLDDPKVGMMNDHLFRRMIELFLLAGRENKDGLLSTPTEIAWTLRTTEKDITAVVTELKRLNVINETEDGRINVTHFAERQSKDTTDYERVKRWRDKQKRINDNGNDTYHDNDDDNGNDNGMKRINDNASDTQKITLDIDIDKDIDFELVNKNKFNFNIEFQETCARVRERTKKEREPYLKFYSDYFCNWLVDPWKSIGYEIVDTMIEAHEQANIFGLKFDHRTIAGKEFIKIITNVDVEQFRSIATQIRFNKDIKNRPYYILGCIVSAARDKRNRMTQQQMNDFIKEMEGE